jgi:hypothetical protein
MAILLYVCTKEEQRVVIRFLWGVVYVGVKIHFPPGQKSVSDFQHKMETVLY